MPLYILLVFCYQWYYDLVFYLFFFFNDPAPTEIYTLSLHDALPIFYYFRDVRGNFNWDGTQGPWKAEDRKSTRLNSSHMSISYAVFCLKKKKNITACLLIKPA